MPRNGESRAQLDFLHFPEAYGRGLKCFGRPVNIVRE
jgi:hypothetical protein